MENKLNITLSIWGEKLRLVIDSKLTPSNFQSFWLNNPWPFSSKGTIRILGHKTKVIKK